jgi:hypothetical protein
MPFTKQYYCNCTAPYAGRNCSFANQEQLEKLKNMTLEVAKKYTQVGFGEKDLVFLQTTTSSTDLMSDDLVDVLHPLIDYNVGQLNNQTFTDTTEHQNYLQIISNMLEYMQTS